MKYYVRLEHHAETDGHKIGLKACRILKQIIKGESHVFQFDKLSDRAEIELEKKNYVVALELFEKAKENLLKSTYVLTKKSFKHNTRYINSKINETKQNTLPF